MLDIFPAPNYTAGGGVNYTSQVPNDRPRREDLIRLDFQPTDKWRFTGRYMNDKDVELQAYGTTWAGSGSDQLPMPVSHPLPGRNWMVSSTGILNNTTSLEVSVGAGRNALTYDLQAQQLYRANSGLTGLPVPLPGRGRRATTSPGSSSAAAARATPASTRRTRDRSSTRTRPSTRSPT